MKKTISLVLAVLMLTSLLRFYSFDEPAEESGRECGENVTWKYDNLTDTLIIEGTGEMYDYASDSSVKLYSFDIKETAPWIYLRDIIDAVI